MNLEYYKKGFYTTTLLCFILSIYDLFLLYQLATGICLMDFKTPRN